MARNDPEVRLRLSPDLKRRIEDEARFAGRSMNAEIVHRLEQTFAAEAVPMPGTAATEMPGTIWDSVNAIIYAAMHELARLESPMVVRDEDGRLRLHVTAPAPEAASVAAPARRRA